MDRPFPAYKGNEPYIFVGYAHKDAGIVYPELSWMKDIGINVWYDEGIEAGTEWREELARAIREAHLFVYFVTPNSTQSENCRKEVNFALDQDVTILAIHMSPTQLPDGLSLTLSDRQAILKHELRDKTYREKMSQSLSFYLSQPVAASASVPPRKHSKSLIGGVLLAAVLVTASIIAFNWSDQQQPASEPEAATTGTVTSQIVEEKAPVDPVSIAVLPFRALGGDKHNGSFALGLSEDILDKLAQSRYPANGLKVALTEQINLSRKWLHRQKNMITLI
jgi:hypothetical protein